MWMYSLGDVLKLPLNMALTVRDLSDAKCLATKRQHTNAMKVAGMKNSSRTEINRVQVVICTN